MNKLKTFSDVVAMIDKKRQSMFDNNPLFKTLASDKISYEKRLSFIPYMLFFSCGCPDVITLIMRSDKPTNELTPIEQKINAFVNEDNFHYNFYLKDFETLGYTFQAFGSSSAVIRHVYSEESIAVRKLVYAISYYCHQHYDPLIRLTVTEILEGGLYDLFTSIYTHIIKKDDSPFANLQYYGDTHVHLEQNHSVTGWFSGDQETVGKVAHITIPEHLAPMIMQTVDELMDHFNAMYESFDKVIHSERPINADKFIVEGLPPIDKVTSSVLSMVEHKVTQLKESIEAMKHHPVFGKVQTIEQLRIFMEWHVFAVWDFMSLVKRLQLELTSTTLPWLPPKNRKFARLINEIVLGEESDEVTNDTHASHFELYLMAMQEVNADVSTIHQFVNYLQKGCTVTEALSQIDIPLAIKSFVMSTIDTATHGSLMSVLGSFFYGREDVIPSMFQCLLDSWTVHPEEAPMFVYYLQRHIALDSENHGPAIQKIINEMTEGNEDSLGELIDAAILAVNQRIKLWDALEKTLDASNPIVKLKAVNEC